MSGVGRARSRRASQTRKPRASSSAARSCRKAPGAARGNHEVMEAAWRRQSAGPRNRFAERGLRLELAKGTAPRDCRKEEPPSYRGFGEEMEREKGFEPAEAAHANRATGHANPPDSPGPQRFRRPSFSSSVRSRPRPSPDSMEAAWRRQGRRRTGRSEGRRPARFESMEVTLCSLCRFFMNGI